MKLFKNILSLRNRVGAAVFWTILLALIFSTLAILFTDYWLARIAESNKKTIATTEDLLAIYRLKAYLPIAESAQRGYLLTQKKEYLKEAKNIGFENLGTWIRHTLDLECSLIDDDKVRS